MRKQYAGSHNSFLPSISLSGYHFSPSQRHHLISTREMADQSQSTRFQPHFESALEAYEKCTGIKLAQHPLSMGLQSCNPVGSITTFLQSQASAFSDFTENDRLMGLIKVNVWILTTLSATASLDDTFGPVRQKAPMECLTFPTTSHRHCLLWTQHTQALLSYSSYVPFSNFHNCILMTSA